MDFSFIRGIRGNLIEKPREKGTNNLNNKKKEVDLELNNSPRKLTEQVPRLKKMYMTEQVEYTESRNIYKEYQNNIKKAEQLRIELLKGIKVADDSLKLLLKACKCISLMTGDNLFFEQVENNIVNIYGIGLKEPEPIKTELEKVRKRLQKLREVEQKEKQEETRACIAFAIKSHEKREIYLQDLLSQ